MDENKQKTMTEVWSIYERIGAMNSFMGQAALAKGVRDHYRFLQTHQTDFKLERIILEDCKKKMVEASKGAALKLKGYKTDGTPGYVPVSS